MAIDDDYREGYVEHADELVEDAVQGDGPPFPQLLSNQNPFDFEITNGAIIIIINFTTKPITL